MPRKKTVAKLADEKEEAMANVLAQVLIETCHVIDAAIDDHDMGALLQFGPVVAQMECYLDGRKAERTDPVWVVQLRRTVTRFRIRAILSRTASSPELH